MFTIFEHSGRIKNQAFVPSSGREESRIKETKEGTPASYFLLITSKLWPILVIALLVLILAFLNYQPGTILTGGDNLHPEFNFPLNIHRSLFAVWQEFQGLGVLGGMGHASDLIRQLLLLLLSVVIPMHMLRFVWTMLMLFVGTVGAYVLIDYLISKKTSKLISLLGALFYLFNLSTMQTFYIPFESFTAFFGFLPWLLLTALLYLEKQNKKTLLFFCLILLLATPAWYVPTLFVVFLITLTIIFFAISATSLMKVAKLYLLIFLTNAFWLLPFLYFALTNSHVVLDAKINQMATSTVLLQNKEFGSLTDVMLLKGFWFNYVDPNLQGKFTYTFLPWRNHLSNPFIVSLGYAFFAIILFGIYSAITSKNRLLLGWTAVFVFSVTALSIATPPFSWIDNIAFSHIPLVQEAFRFPFTKFSTLASLAHAIFFAVGIKEILSRATGRNVAITIIATVSVIIFMSPLFQGHLFYQKEQVRIPKEYFDVFHFFNKQDPNSRIADFPQYTYWGWSFYKWGYGGSGFLWYGIKQPILDRNFDMWNKNNENYYWEVSYALHEKNPQLLGHILDKYQVTWVMVDKNTFSPDNPTLHLAEKQEAMIKQIPGIEKYITFGSIDIYKHPLLQKPKDFIFLKQNLPSINIYTWGEFDRTYVDKQDYIAKSQTGIVYPFPSLFTGKLQDKQFQVEEQNDAIVFTSSIKQDLTNTMLHIPSYPRNTAVIPVRLATRKNASGDLAVIVNFQTPQIAINDKKIWGNTFSKTIFMIPANETYPLTLTINGEDTYSVTYDDTTIGTSFLFTRHDNTISLSDHKQTLAKQVIHGLSLDIPEIFYQDQAIPLASVKNGSVLTIAIPKFTNHENSFVVNPADEMSQVKNCDYFRRNNISAKVENNLLELSALNADACISLYSKHLPHENGYVVFIKSNNITGRSLHFWVDNVNEKNAPIDTFLDNKRRNDAVMILPPLEQFGREYAFHFDNISIGRDPTINQLGRLAVYQIPYDFLTSTYVENSNAAIYHSSNLSQDFAVDHPNESSYTLFINRLKTNDQEPTTIILSQSFDPGWKMYQVKNTNWLSMTLPFIFGKEEKNHVLVNNWENGWNVDNLALSNSNEFIIIYLPQYLEYVGLGLLGTTFLWIITRPNLSPVQNPD